MIEAELAPAIAALLRRGLGHEGASVIEPFAASGNNRVYKVEAGGRTVIAKWYCDDAPSASQRDRLDAEWRFLTYAALAGIPNVPGALAKDEERRLALHGFCPGSRPQAEMIGPAEIEAAARFLKDLNREESRPAAGHLPIAAEAAFSLDGHVAILERRLANLGEIAPGEGGARYLVKRMREFWEGLKPRLYEGHERLGLAADGLLASSERWISPSDFGFHNAVQDADGALSFIDFEYAGWDDPAKTLCDFQLQPGVPVRPELRPLFLEAVLADRSDGEAILARSALMMPLFALKWCCILLNPFVPGRSRPGLFSDPAADQALRKAGQLMKAQAAFEALKAST